jgi:hypothetical protein
VKREHQVPLHLKISLRSDQTQFPGVVLVVPLLEGVGLDVNAGAVEVEVARLQLCPIIVYSMPAKLP